MADQPLPNTCPTCKVSPFGPCPRCQQFNEVLPKDFRLAASDSNGHRDRIQVSIHPDIHNRAKKHVGTGIFSYSGFPALVRHALLRHIEFLDRLDPVGVPGNLQRFKAMEYAATEALQHNQMLEMIMSIDETLSREIYRNNPNMAKDYVLNIRKEALGLPEPDWREAMLKVMDEKYGDKFYPEQMAAEADAKKLIEETTIVPGFADEISALNGAFVEGASFGKLIDDELSSDPV